MKSEIRYCPTCPIEALTDPRAAQRFWGEKTLSWEVPKAGKPGCCHSLIDELQFRRDIQMAQRELAQFLQLDFIDVTDIPLSQRGPAQLHYSFALIDGPGRTLGQAYLPSAPPPYRGRCQFDVVERFRRSDHSPIHGSRNDIDFVSVCGHETWHLLGYGHIQPEDDPDSMLLPFYNGTMRVSSAGDIARAQAHYAVRQTEMLPPKDYFPGLDVPEDPRDRARHAAWCREIRKMLRA